MLFVEGAVLAYVRIMRLCKESCIEITSLYTIELLVFRYQIMMYWYLENLPHLVFRELTPSGPLILGD